MKTVLVFSTSTGNANTEMLDGVRKFAQGTDWNIQSVKYGGAPFPIRELLKFWSPIGCIVEASGNGLRKDSIPYRAFGKTPVVYIGGDSLVVPPNATCVVHDAHATSETAARELLPLDVLSDTDMALLKENSELIRFSFEQLNMPASVLSGESDLYALMSANKKDELRNEIYNAWRKNAAAYILNLQIGSDTEYELSTPLDPSDPDLLDGYDKILKAAALDTETIFDGVDVSEAKSGIRTAVLSFKTADKMTDCKYIGISASKDGRLRYFTAENNIMQTDTWYFCEVTNDDRGTITGFKKTDADTDLKSFIALCEKAFDENLQPTARSSKHPAGVAEKSE